MSANNLGLLQYSPLQEYDVARVGFNLKRSERFFMLFHKKIITKVCPKLAKVTTVRNFTCYNSVFYIARDICIKLTEIFKLVINMYRKSEVAAVIPGSTGVSLYDNAKKVEYFNELIKVLIKTEIVNPEIDIQTLDSVMFDRLLTVAKFINIINTEDTYK